METSPVLLDQFRVVYTSESPWQEEHEHILLMACSDPRFREATKEFMENHVGATRYDSLIIPGGPAQILLSSSIFFAIQPLAQLLHRAHELKKVIAMAHHGCMYYRTKYPRLTEGELQRLQVLDLLECKKVTEKLVARAEVKLYFAQPRDGHVRFIAVEE